MYSRPCRRISLRRAQEYTEDRRDKSTSNNSKLDEENLKKLSKKIVQLKAFLLKNLKSKVHALCMRINVCQQKHNAKKKKLHLFLTIEFQ